MERFDTVVIGAGISGLTASGHRTAERIARHDIPIDTLWR